MKNLIFSFFLFISQDLSAGEWSIGNESLSIDRCPKHFCLISKVCLTNPKSECQALKAMNNRVKSDTGPGGTNPGSSVCQKHHKGSVFIAKDKEGNEVAFCRFSDDSFISLDGLWHW